MSLSRQPMACHTWSTVLQAREVANVDFCHSLGASITVRSGATLQTRNNFAIARESSPPDPEPFLSRSRRYPSSVHEPPVISSATSPSVVHSPAYVPCCFVGALM